MGGQSLDSWSDFALAAADSAQSGFSAQDKDSDTGCLPLSALATDSAGLVIG